MSTISISPSNGSLPLGQSQKFTATVLGQPEGSTISYSWKIDGDVSVNNSTNTLDFLSKSPRTYTIEVTATITSSEGESEVITATTSFTSVNNIKASITPKFQEATQLDEVTLSVDVIGAPDGSKIEYLWSNGATTKSFTKHVIIEGTYIFNCLVNITLQNGEVISIQTEDSSIKVNEKEVSNVYAHPLPHRNSAYIWVGWWVMEEIQRLTLDGKNWKLDFVGSKYEDHILILVNLLADYPELDVQESKNGRIIHKSALDLGIIYDYYIY